MGLKAYIAGKISGDKQYADKFNKAADRLRAKCCTVVNPATLPEGMEKDDYMRICLAMIDCCDIVVALPDAMQSGGQKLKLLIAIT